MKGTMIYMVRLISMPQARRQEYFTLEERYTRIKYLSSCIPNTLYKLLYFSLGRPLSIAMIFLSVSWWFEIEIRSPYL